jgi:hypothetical protein
MTFAQATKAAVLSVLIPGSGHLYLGKASRYFWLALALVAIYLSLAFGGLLSTFAGMATFLALGTALLLFGVIDSFWQGRKYGRNFRAYSSWYVIAAFALLLFALSQLIVTFREPVLGYAMYRVPTSSMAPAIVAGDYVLIDTRQRAVPSINDVVTVSQPSLGGTVLRRVRSSPSPGVLELVSDSPLSPESDAGLRAVPADLIKGHITTIFWSPARHLFGIKVP